MELKIVSQSPAMTRKIARQIAKKIMAGELLLLEGDLGSGKTVFVQGLAQGLGISPRNVRSPTFAIIQEYPAPKLQEKMRATFSASFPFRKVHSYSSSSQSCKSGAGLCHVDLYRVALSEIRNLGLEEYWQNKKWVIAVEWANKANFFFPPSALTIKFNLLSKNKRELIFSGGDRWKKQLKKF